MSFIAQHQQHRLPAYAWLLFGIAAGLALHWPALQRHLTSDSLSLIGTCIKRTAVEKS